MSEKAIAVENYHLKQENDDLAMQLFLLSDDDFYDTMMCLAQLMDISWQDVNKFTEKLRIILTEIQYTLNS